MQRGTPKECFVLLKIKFVHYHQFITQGSRKCKKDKKNRNLMFFLWL